MRGTSTEALIVFTANWQHALAGTLVPGGSFTVVYDSSRILQERWSPYHGIPEWDILGYTQYSTDGPVSYKNLGLTMRAEALFQQYTIPEDAHELIMWFYHAGRGKQFYDSNYGRNYHFPIMRRDVELLGASVISDVATPYSGFSVRVAAVPAVTGVLIRHTPVPNFVGNPPSSTIHLERTRQPDERGLAIWQATNIIVPYRATVVLSIDYVIREQLYSADNGKLYIAS